MDPLLAICHKRGAPSLNGPFPLQAIVWIPLKGYSGSPPGRVGDPTPQMEEAPASYVAALQAKLRASAQLAQEELTQAQEDQKRHYDTQVRPQCFEPGQKVLLLLPSSSNIAYGVAGSL